MASSGRGGLIAAGIVAALLVIAVIAFTSGTTTDPGTTAVIPDQTEDTAPAPAPAE
jgi:Meckel syndrome type 1 protein